MQKGMLDEVLEGYVHQLNDTISALEFCIEQPCPNFWIKKLLLLLLSPSQFDHTKDLLELIQQHLEQFDLIELLDLLPSTWSITLIGSFLVSGNGFLKRETVDCQMRLRLWKAYQSKVVCTNQLQHRMLHFQQKVPLLIDGTRLCSKCKLPLVKFQFAYHDGEISHIDCAENI
jgi:hypothetical protein